jgi:hypothetical protein
MTPPLLALTRAAAFTAASGSSTGADRDWRRPISLRCAMMPGTFVIPTYAAITSPIPTTNADTNAIISAITEPP